MPNRRLPDALRRGLTFWRRSIQARVVVSTVLLSAAVVSGVGWFLLQQTREGLLEHRVDAVVAEANNETAEARTRLEAASATDTAGRQKGELVDPIRLRGEARGFDVVLAGPVGGPGAEIGGGGAMSTPGLDTSSVPSSLEEHFSTPAGTAWTYTTITTTNADGVVETAPGIVVGAQVALPADSQTYTLYYLFPLTEEQETLGLVSQALLTAAVLLLVLVAGLTWLVTRQVVTPIRMARRVAERLAAGQLQQRLRVSGEDDLARLATSFNQMATSLQRQIRQLEELSRVQRRFVSDVSHELRTPLTTVRMAGDVLHDARADFDPATSRAAELLQTELDRFETLLVDLLEISRFDAGAAVLDTDDVNLVDVAHRVVDMTAGPGRPAVHAGRGPGARAPLPGGGRRTPRGADRAQPRHQRDRPRRDRRHRDPRGGRRRRSRHRCPRLRRRAGLGGVGDGLQPLLAGRPGACADQWRHRPRPLDLARGHPPARRLAPGLGPARRGCPVPPDPAAPGGWRAPPEPAAARARRRRGAGRMNTHLTPRARRTAAVLATCLTVVVLPGCVRLPESGPVVETESEGSLDAPPAISIDPKPPQAGEGPEQIVSDFLEAMTATPISTNVARQYLTSDADAAWNPEAQTITYAEASDPRGNDVLTVRLTGASRLDSRGSFRGKLPASQRTLEFRMGLEDGEWRIAHAPDALVVPDSWFEPRFRQVSLYFFDPSAQVLVPEPVFVQRGEPGTTALTEALLRGPGPNLDGVSRSFIPPGLDFDLSVPVSDEGVADLNLRGYSGQLTPEASELMITQLAWTLGQEPGIEAIRVSLGDQPITSATGQSLFDVNEQSEYDPTGLDSSSLFYGLRDGLLVSAGQPDALAPVGGPMGTLDVGARSIAVNLDGTIVAAVSGEGASVLESSVPGPRRRVEEVVSGADNLLRPAWDLAGRLWLVDAASGGAVFSLVNGVRPREINVPGLSGERVTQFLVSRDGSRIVASVRGSNGDQLMVSRLRRNDQGGITGATRARRDRLGGRRRAADPRHRLDLHDVDRRPPPRGQQPVRGAHHLRRRVAVRRGRPADQAVGVGLGADRVARTAREPVRRHGDLARRPHPRRHRRRGRRPGGHVPRLRRLTRTVLHRPPAPG